MKKIFIFGSGDVVKDICLLINKINDINPTWEIMGFIDKDPALIGQEILGLPIISLDKITIENNYFGICGISKPKVKERVVNDEILHNGYKLATITHPDIEYRDDVVIGKGTIIFSGVKFGFNVKIGNSVWLDKNVLLGHDTVIGDYSSIMPSAVISGKSKLGSGCTVGAGSILHQNINVGDDSLIGIGTTVIKNIPEKTHVTDFPRKIIRENL
jgi:sugar O-acyltransferase (sialic acid O-acetyltransferase NeuD family)